MIYDYKVKTAKGGELDLSEYKGKVIIDDKLKAAIDAYYEQYGVK